ncbi:hypothetical protein TIFTF001_029236 [Ficus carica]|uniref:Uncharacterized protein n=1 Tax=Ficus carica TaxID=3494 RepID=A0AA88DR68_FICCA|nr:hypothetical protein TIFTF001_029236 [Ficus carica]
MSNHYLRPTTLTSTVAPLPVTSMASCRSLLLTAERLASVSRNTRSHWVLLPEPFLASTHAMAGVQAPETM